MTEWSISLRGHKSDLQALERGLVSPSLHIVERDGCYYLRSSDFTGLASPDDVRGRASDLLQIMSGAAMVHQVNFQPIELAAVVRQDDNGEHQFVWDSDRGTVREDESVVVTVIRGDGSTTETKLRAPALNIEPAVMAAANDELVQRALRIWGSREHNWFNLCNVVEIIERDVCGESVIVSRGWASRNVLERLRSTGNNPELVGDEARHGVEQQGRRPKHSMSLQQAVALVRHILAAWLESKVAHK